MNEDSKRSPQGCRNSFEKSESNCQRNESNKTIYNNLNEERVKTTKKRSHFNEFFVPYASKPKASILTESFYSQDNPLISLTHNIIQSYKKNNPNFNYRLNFNPKRALTKPSIPTYNNGYDNENHDLIIHVNSILGTDDGQRYVVVDILGQGTFGQVVRCQNLKTKEYVAIKIIKGKQAYFNQSMMEITILELLNQHYDPNNNNHLIRLFDTFSYRNHLCLVFELLSVSLYDLIKQNKFRGLSPNLIRVFAKQILEGLVLLSEAHIIHADLKPENILLKNLDSPELKIIDFGSACHEHKTIYTYIQSRFYRSPEVILGLPYSASIDMWSVGCILVELFLGLPLFPGTSEYNQLSRIVELLGNPPQYMLEFGKNSEEFFNKTNNGHGNKSYQLKSIHQYSNEKGVEEAPSKRYFPLIPIPELIRTYPILKKNSTPLELQKENEERLKFTDFVLGFLTLNPIERWSPQQALLHPFVTGEPYRGHFKPPSILRNSSNTATDALYSNVPHNIHHNSVYHNSSQRNTTSVDSFNQCVTLNTHIQNQSHSNGNVPISGLKTIKLKSRARANTVNASISGNIPFPIQQASDAASSENNRRSQVLSYTNNNTLKQTLKSQKRFSMPNPATKLINQKEVDDYSVDSDQEYARMEAGFSKFSISSESTQHKGYNKTKPVALSKASPSNLSPLNKTIPLLRGSSLANVIPNKPNSSLKPPTSPITQCSDTLLPTDTNTLFSGSTLHTGYPFSNKNNFIPKKQSPVGYSSSNNDSFLKDPLKIFKSPSNTYSRDTINKLSISHNSRSSFSVQSQNTHLLTHSKNKSFNDYGKGVPEYQTHTSCNESSFNTSQNPLVRPNTMVNSTNLSTNSKARRTYSFGWESTIPSGYKSTISPISDLPSQLENHDKINFLQTRSASYTSSSNHPQQNYMESGRTNSMDSSLPHWDTYNGGVKKIGNPTRGSQHRPAYLTEQFKNQEQFTQSSSGSRRRTLDSSPTQPSF